MKRITSIFLALALMFQALVFCVNAEDTKLVYSPDGLSLMYLAPTTVSLSMLEDENDKYLRMVISPGDYNNNSGLVDFSSAALKFGEYPYMKFGYRTDSPFELIDLTTRSSLGEGWGTHPKNTSDGKNWSEAIFDIQTVTKANGVDLEQSGAILRFKPWGSGTRTLEEEYFFDFKYIAFFKTEAEAIAYVYDPDDDTTTPSDYYIDKDIIKDGTDMLSTLNSEFDARVDEIKSTPTTVSVSGTKYYVSSKGDDSNDGLSETTPWKTIKRVNDAELLPGDGVFFKRGEHFRAEGTTLALKSGITYSAYGYGEKPVLVGSVDASGVGRWSETEIENVYIFNGNVSNSGSIIFNGGEAWGIRLTRLESDENVTIDNGIVHNGIDEPYHSASRPFDGYKSLQNNLEFFSGNYFYLYCEDGNPGEVFDTIEISDGVTGVSGTDIEDVVFDNIKLFAYARHGIGTHNVKNFTVQNCIFAWIGGGIQGGDTRYGNAVQNWQNADGFVIDNCWAYQTYDCCYTTQYTGTNATDVCIKNVVFKNTLSEYSNSGPEIWNNTKAGTETIAYDNVQVYNNYVRNGGYGWSHQRPSKDGNFYYGGFERPGHSWNDFKFYDNKFFICRLVGLKSRYISQNNSWFNGNTYIIGEDKYFAQSSANLLSPGITDRYYSYNPENLSVLRYYGVEKDGEFYSVPADYTPKPFDYISANDVYTTMNFADSVNHWAKNDIKYVTDRGYFNGISSLEFAPEGSMTRAMLFTALSRHENAELASGEVWYDGAVEWAINSGLTTAENARPDEPVKRGELAVIIERYLKSKHMLTNGKSADFKDAAIFKNAVNDSDDFTYDELVGAIDYCVKAGILNGYDDNRFYAEKKTTRAQIAAVFSRIDTFEASCDYDFDGAIADNKINLLDDNLLFNILNDSRNSSTKSHSDEGYVRFVPLDKESGTVQIDLHQNKLENIDFFEKKYVKVRYRLTRETDGVSIETLDVGLRWPTEQWLYTYDRPRINKLGEWQTGIFRYQDFTGSSKCELPNTSLDTYYYTFKPWGNNVQLSSKYYFDISDVAFFESEYMAKSYNFE